MIKLLIESHSNLKSSAVNSNIFENSLSFLNLSVHFSKPYHEWVNSQNEKCIILGEVIGIIKNDGTTKKILEDKSIIEYVDNFDQIPELEGRFIFFKISKNGELTICSDNFGKVDIYKYIINDHIYLASSLDLLPLSNSKLNIDQVAMAHSLIVYGSRPAKKHTLYQNISRIGVNEAFIVNNGNIEILKRKFIPISTSPNYSDDKLEDYSEYFIEAIKSRASENGNVVYISGGWDSTAILAVLVHLFGKEKTRCIIGRQKFSKRTGISNQIEIDKATAICDYFGVKLDIIDLNFMTGADDILRRVKDLALSHNFANMTTITHFMIAEAASKMFKGNEAFFAGEMSDGAHNFGFSQFVTIYHPASKSFREYSDKMASYLYGPTFLNQLFNNTYKDDPIWKIFMQYNPDIKFDELKTGKIEINKQFLSSFFLRSGRIPLYSIDNSKLLTKYGAELFVNQSEEIYLKEAYESLTPDTLYSHILHLYNTFHWQCATVTTHEYTAASFGLKLYQPYRDKAILNFLSGMPESWGRGLDFRNTKFPLKWMLKNKINYPYHLQEGPHAYIYDEDPSFNHAAEVLYGSSWNEVFKKSLNDGKFINLLDDKIFNMSYINEITSEFNLDKEVRGQRMTDLFALCVHSAVGLYNE